MPKNEGEGEIAETASTSPTGDSQTQGPALSTDSTQPNPSTLPNPFSAIATHIDSTIPQYEKLEISFQLDTVASNLQFPFDANPPPGVEPAIGVTVDAEFTPDNWETIFIQPAFYYQHFLDEERDGQEWLYPTEQFEWRVRFSPNTTGEWQVRLKMEDVNGRYQTDPFPFSVTPSENQGFIRVSERDARYFEYDNGDYFQAMGVNLELPSNLDQLPIWADSGVQLIRTYLPSQYSIWGAAWSPWRSVGASDLGQETNARLRHDGSPGIDDAPIAIPGHDFFLWLSHDETVFEDGQQRRHFPCAVMGWNVPPIPAQPNTSYRVRVRYRLGELGDAKVAGEPAGLTVKTAQWLWNRRDETEQCTYPNTGNLVAASYEASPIPDPEFDGWMIMEGEINSGNASFLPRLWLAIENVSSGSAYIDQVWIEAADGPNVAYKSSMANHLYFDQRSSFAFDKGLTAAEAAGLALKLVVMEKGDYALNQFDNDGNLIDAPLAQGAERPFYGNGRQLTKIRWLQQAYWRYLQARWGYSTAVHSWELLNEGNPASEAHYILADEFGKYMQSFTLERQGSPHPNSHLVTTSFWNGFPQPFWSSGDYPYIDYADVHHYARPNPIQQFSNLYAQEDFFDAAQFSIKLSEALQERTPTMPVVRGEVGFLFANENLFASGNVFAANATNGVWLHNLIWSGINAGSMVELYWTGAPTQNHIVGDAHDHRALFRPFANFMADVPLSNGRYVNAAPTTSTSQLRAWGQQDVEAGRAHLWIQNGEHIWGNIARETAVTPISGTVTLTGFTSNETYTATWWDTAQPDPTQQILRTEMIIADGNGTLILIVEELVGDTAVKITR